MNPFILLLLLNVCHWAGDYTHLSTAEMLGAKRLGKPLTPIFAHATVHFILMFIVVFPASLNEPGTMILVLLIQLISHFLIDVLKGRLNGWFPRLSDPSNKFHWWIFGIDQFLHQSVIILMVYLITNPM